VFAAESLGRRCSVASPLAICYGNLSRLHFACVLQPTDLVKVRFQSEGRLLPGQKPRYSGVLNAYSTIVRQEGLLGLWTGLGPAIARNSVINAVELVTYDTTKQVRHHRCGSCSCDASAYQLEPPHVALASLPESITRIAPFVSIAVAAEQREDA